MKNLIAIGLGAVLALSSAAPVPAHSLKSLEEQLHKREKYFQAFNKEAPVFALRDAAGRTNSSSDLRGKVVVLNFVYTNCPDVCPLHAERIAEVQGMVNQTPMRDRVRFITVTTDPRNDTLAVMRTYGENHGLDSVNWSFLTSGPKRLNLIRDLVRQFGHKFTKQGDSYQVRGVVTHVIDPEGRWRANFYGLNFQPINLVLFINALTNDIHGGNAMPRVLAANQNVSLK